MLNYDLIMTEADLKYKELKSQKHPFVAPELLPDGIQSDQIRALAWALLNEINREFDNLKYEYQKK